MAVISVTEDQIPDQIGNLIDVYTISFTVANRPGSFTVQIPQAGDPIAAARDAIDAVSGQVTSLYGL